MPCVNHPEANVQSYCQNCGKALCGQCVRATPDGRILCEECWAAGPVSQPGPSGQPGQVNPAQAYWQAYVTPPRGAPNPALAAVLGLIPGVGAMYNAQFFKALVHVAIFAVLVAITDQHIIFLIFVFAWVFYQSFEAYHTAKARRDGLPVPDPFGLNELGSWLNISATFRGNIHPTGHAGQVPPVDPASWSASGSASGPAYGPSSGAGSAQGETPGQGYSPPYAPPVTGEWGAGYAPPPFSEPYTGQYQDPYAGYYPPGNMPPGSSPPGYIPPIPPIPPSPMTDSSGAPLRYRRQEPMWAFILIGLGVLFLLKTVGIFDHVFHFFWPIALIGLGVFLIVRHMGSTRGGSQ